MRKLLDLDFTKITTFPRDIFNVSVGEKWANKELQRYVDDTNHLYLDQGLVLQATYDEGTYTSARINTKGKFSFLYGKIDIVAKLPEGRGTWPALWMMSETEKYGRWPRSGEIDIMEHVGNELDEIYMCLHTAKYNHREDRQYFHKSVFKGISKGFHKYSLLWQSDKITYLIDDLEVKVYVRGMDDYDSSAEGWPFDEPFYLIINLAIGGMLGGVPEPSDYPQKFVIKSIVVTQT
ncbi:MAG: glycoside hydrolase family 16 protein [Bacilli bacterium]|nr:glycoside hydrolase family 16 protein [Bacilli bacterium]